MSFDASLVQPEQLDGAEVLDQAHAALTTFCALPSPEAADAVVLWIAGTHAVPAFDAAPRLVVTSATKRSGKTRLLEVVEGTCSNPLATANATSAAIFRSLGKTRPPTLVFDEVDTIFGSQRVAEQNEELRGLLNAGFQRGKPALRCVGPNQVPTEFSTFAWAALAGIGGVPDTVSDRAVNVTMRRRKPDEVVRPFRERRDRPTLDAVADLLERWLGDDATADKLGAAQPAMELEDRAADVWEPLIAVADFAGGSWPARARAAARLLTSATEDEAEDSLSVRLLHDMRDLFGAKLADFQPTSEVVLPFLRNEVTDGPWRDMDLTPHRLGKMLREFGVKSVRDSSGTRRGYRRNDFRDAWDRYPRPDHASEPSDSVNTGSDLRKQSDASSDASDATSEASEQVSARSRRPEGVLTDSDASDAYPARVRPLRSPSTKGRTA